MRSERPATDCEHRPVWVGRVAMIPCADCGTVDWMSDLGSVDHAEAMAHLFGSYDLIDTLTALGAPSSEVLVYAPPSARRRRHLEHLPENVWLRCGPRLWMSTDHQVLLLSTTHRLLHDNLTRGA